MPRPRGYDMTPLELESQDSELGSIAYDVDLESPSNASAAGAGVGLDTHTGERSRSKHRRLRGLSSSSTGPDTPRLESSQYDREPLLAHDSKDRSCLGRLKQCLRSKGDDVKEIVLNFKGIHQDELDEFSRARERASFGQPKLRPLVTTLPAGPFPANKIRNQKYSVLTFLPVVLFQQFQFFFNFYFLLVACTQFIPALQVGYAWTYWAPLGFVLAVTIGKEAFDDFQRFMRDKEINNQTVDRLTPYGKETIACSDIKVGDLIFLHTNQRVPADCVLFRTNADNRGSIFIRTDQLDGETDWKLRKAVPSLQRLADDSDLTRMNAAMVVAGPNDAIYEFVGNFSNDSEEDAEEHVESLSLENTLWTNTVIASGTAIACVVYTGSQTRSAMNTVSAPTKVGILDLEVNRLAKVLFVMMVVLGLALGLARGAYGLWYMVFFRFVLLLSSIIPISLRVNLDMGKTLYSMLMMKDKEIPNTIVRNSTIPEELGRLTYLFSDKTGTLTQNVMRFKKMQLEPPSGFSNKQGDELRGHVGRYFESLDRRNSSSSSSEHKQAELGGGDMLVGTTATASQFVVAMALCHNVTPVTEEDGTRAYQASSPDEIALVKYTEELGVRLVHRSQDELHIETPHGKILKYEVLRIFPFTSEAKRMGIIVREQETQQILFLLKGAETVMQQKIDPVFWLQEEVDNLAREGLRTLVFAQKTLTPEEYDKFSSLYESAKSVIQNREAQVRAVIESIEVDLHLLGISGVEDRLQEDVKPTLELLKQAGIRIWMLTGDKAETAISVGRSAGLITHSQKVFAILVKTHTEAARQLDLFGMAAQEGAALVIDGVSLQFCLDFHQQRFLEFCIQADVVIVCRCSPTQKATVVQLVKEYTEARVCAVGDGGNDVSMIQAAHVGIGIVGLEGRQASLAADFSVEQFSFISRLILWHGRNSYIRSARLAQFVFHRGVIISIMQAVFSAIFFFATLALFDGWLLVGYSTVYTMAPVFSLVLDEDVTPQNILNFPQLYQYLQRGHPLSMKVFAIWIFQSVYQGGIIMWLSIFLFEEELINIVAITFTALIFSELVNVALEITKWNYWMVGAEVLSVVLYIASIFILDEYFDSQFVTSIDFFWKTVVITTVSCLPVSLGRCIHRKLRPPAHQKIKTDD